MGELNCVVYSEKLAREPANRSWSDLVFCTAIWASFSTCERVFFFAETWL